MKTRKCPFNMKPEHVDEMTLNEPTAIKHKAACVWKLLGSTYSQDQLQLYCSLYNISTDQALMWKSYWLSG